ncbi:MAG: beta strand repeat-containing protein [Alphaproteobacteria bacterium]
MANIKGNAGSNVLAGGAGNDILKGRAGDDTIFGGAGNDRLRGGAGRDTLDGANGNDILWGGRGEDVLDGGGGDDRLKGGRGDDVLRGGEGSDRLSGGAGNDTLDGGGGNDRLDGGAGNDTLDGGAGSDLVKGGAGNDLGIYVAAENRGVIDRYDGGQGFDTLRLQLTSSEYANSAVRADIAAFQRFLRANCRTDSEGRESFHFTSLGLDARGWEALEIVVRSDSTNTAPTARADALAAAEDGGPVSIDLLANDSDIDAGDSLTVVSVSPLLPGGTLSLSSSVLSFDPGPGFQSLAFGQTASETLTYVVRDRSGATASATVTLTITGANDAPVAVADDAATHEDAISAFGNVLANDGDIDAGAALRVTASGHFAGRYGDLALAADGGYVYTLDARAADHLAAGATASEIFAYAVTDGLASATATLTITIAGRNDAPVAVDDWALTAEDSDTPVIGNVLANDEDRDDGAVLAVGNAGSFRGLYGTLTLDADGRYSYVLDNSLAAVQALGGNEAAEDRFFYTLNDGTATSSATLAISVAGRDDPMALADDLNEAVEGSLQIATGNVLDNDFDLDAAPLGVLNAGTISGTFGELTLEADGDYFYRLYDGAPAVEFLAAGDVVFESFNYQAGDGFSIASATLSFVVTGTNDAPLATSDSAVLTEDGTAVVAVTANDIDPDRGDILRVVGASGALHGAVSYSGGSVTYRPAANFAGTDSFLYVVSDGKGGFGTGSVAVTVEASADLPLLTAPAELAVAPGALALGIAAALADRDGSEALSELTLSGLPEGASLSAGNRQSDGTWTVRAEDLPGLALSVPDGLADDFTLTVSVTATEASNGDAKTAVANIAVTVDNEASAPELSVAPAAGDEDAAIALSVSATLGDLDGSETLTLEISGVPAGAHLSAGTNLGDGVWALSRTDLAGLTITPPPGSNEDMALVIAATSTEARGGAETTVTAAIAVTVAGVADAPSLAIAEADLAIDEDEGVLLGLTAALGDLDGSESLTVEISGLPSGARLSAGIDLGAGVWRVGGAALPGLSLIGAANSDEDFVLGVRAIAREDDGSEAVVTAAISVAVNAVADAPILSAVDATGAEDAPVALDIRAALADLDGSETLSAVTISGMPEGARLSAGTDNGDGTWTLAASELAGLTLTPPANMSAAIVLNVSARATEASNHDTALATASITITLEARADVPVIGAPSVPPSGEEDTAIALDFSAVLGDGDGSEVLSISVAGLPEGARLSAGTANPDGTWTLAAGDLPGLRATPAADSDEDFVLTITATATEIQTGDISVATAAIAVTVNAVADAPAILALPASGSEDGWIALSISAALADTDGSEVLGDITVAGVPEGALLSAGTKNPDSTWTLKANDLAGLAIRPPANVDATMNLTVSVAATEGENLASMTTSAAIRIAVQAVADAPQILLRDSSGSEDSAVALQIAAVLVDADGSEFLGPVTIAGLPAGATLSAGTANPDGSYTLAPSQLAGLRLLPPEGFDGAFALVVTAHSTEAANGDIAIATASLNVTIAPVADAPQVAAPSVVHGLEDGQVALDIRAAVTDTDGSEIIARVTIAGVPAGATLSAGTDNGDGTWTVGGGDLAGLTLAPPANSDGDIALALTVFTRELSTGAEASTTAAMIVEIAAVADEPSVSAAGASGAEDSAIEFSIAGALGDTDGSEILSVRLSGLPDGATLSAGTNNGDGSWTIPGESLSGLRLTPPANFHGTLQLAVSAVATETSNADLASTTASFSVTVTPVNDAPTAPVDRDETVNAVHEDAATGTLVGIAAEATDVDSGAVLGYRLLDDAGGRFAIDAVTGVVRVADGTRIDYESQSSHTILVEVSDGALSATKSFTIDVRDLAPAASLDADFAPNLVPEGVAAGTMVGIRAHATDPAGGAIIYTLLDDAGGRFAIDAASGIVTVANAAVLDYESGSTQNILVSASSGSLSSLASFTINLLNAAPTSPADGDNAPNQVLENSGAGTLVGIAALAFDPAGGAVTYSLLDNAGGRFAIDAATGVVTVAAGGAIDYETARGHTIIVQVSDGAKTSSAGFAIDVVNVVENLVSLANLGAGGGGFKIAAASAGDGLGVGISNAGDVNGDGYADVIIGAEAADPFGRVNAGAAYVVYGAADNANLDLAAMTATRGAVILGGAAGNQFAAAVGFGGDVNRDGFDDVVATAPQAGVPGSGKGYVIYGGSSALGAGAVDAGALTSQIGFTISEGNLNSYLGQSAHAVGDFNRDGYSDVAYGERYGDSPGGFNQGRVYVVFGAANFTPDINALGLNGTNGFVLYGANLLDGAGESVHGAGDVNGDGADDLIIGAGGSDANGSDAGSAYLVFGSPGRLGGNSLASARLDSSFVDGTRAVRLDGGAAGDLAGRSVSSAGDINGDGFGDLVIGAPSADPAGRADAGAAYVVYGKASGFGASISLGDLDGTNGFVVRGAASGDNLGLSVSAAGDFNGDGLDDFVVAAPGADVADAGDAGRVYVVYGKAGGFGASLDLSQTMAESDGFEVSGFVAGDLAGRSISAAGDVNGDGFDDIAIGAPNHASGAGEAYVVFGGNYSGAATGVGGAGADVMAGTEGDDVLFGRQGNDTVSGGAGADRLSGGAGNDRLDGGAGSDALVGGGGADIFVFTDGGGADRIEDFDALRGDRLDLSAFGFGNGSAALQAAHDVGANCVIQLDLDDSVTLLGVAKSELTLSAFLI